MGWCVSGKYTQPILALLATIVVIVSLVAPYPFTAVGIATAQSCNQTGQYDFCVESVNVSPNDANPGEQVQVTVSIENTGQKLGTVKTVLGIERPDGSRLYPDSAKIYDIPVGDTKSVTLTWTVPDDAVLGSYLANIDVYNPDQSHMFDTTGFNYPFEVSSQYGTVEGKVTDGDGNPIDGAKVYLDSTTDTRTDSNGHYSFSDVSEGQHNLYVTAGACYEQPDKNIEVSGGQTTTEDFQLSSKKYSVSLDTEPVTATTSGEDTYKCGKDVSVSTEDSVGDYEFQKWVDQDGDSISTDPSFTLSYLSSNKDLTAQYAKPGKPDLTVSDISWSPSKPTEGDEITFGVTVSNNGEARASDADVEVSVGGSGFRFNNFNIDAGTSKTFDLDGSWTAKKSVSQVSAEVDYPGDIDEEDETNNERDESISVQDAKPDLKVTDVRIRPSDPSAGEDIEFQLDFKNTGDVAAKSIEGKFYVDGELATMPSTMDVGAGETHTSPWTGSYTISSGSHDIKGVVDPENKISEYNEDNNAATIIKQVSTEYGSVEGRITDSQGNPVTGVNVYLDPTTGTKPDSNGYYSFTEVPAGQYNIEATGSGYDSKTQQVDVVEGESATADFQLSSSTYKVALSSEPVDVSTQGGNTYSYGSKVDISAPIEKGEYEFQEWVDPNGNTISKDSSFTIESLTSDQDLTAQYQKPGTPELSIQSVNLNESNPVDGDKVKFKIEVANTGDARAANFRTEVSVDDKLLRTTQVDLEAGKTKTLELGAWKAESSVSQAKTTVDFEDQVSEENEENNEVTTSVDIAESYSLKGVVTDANGDPVSGIKVYLDSTTDTRTDSNGEYAFQDVSAGTYDVEVTGSGYKSKTKSVEIIEGETSTQDFQVTATEYSVTLSTDPVDASTTGGDIYNPGAQVDISAPAKKNGHEFQKWVDSNDNTISKTRSFTIDKISQNYDLTAQYQQVGKPDLTITSFQASPTEPTEGDQIEFKLTLANQGAVDAEKVDAEVQIDGETVSLPDSVSIQSGNEYTTDWFGSYTASTGTHDATATVDPTNSTTESSENNNQEQRIIEVKREQTTAPEETENNGGSSTGGGGGGGLISSDPSTPETTTTEKATTETTTTTTTTDTTTEVITTTTKPQKEADTEVTTSSEPESEAPNTGAASGESNSQGSLSVTVLNKEKTPIENAVIKLTGTVDRNVRTDQNGQTNFEKIPTGTYAVGVIQNGRTVTQTVSISPDHTRDLQFEVKDATAIFKGQVLTEDGTPVKNVRVKIAGKSTQVDETGHFEFNSEFSTGKHVVRVYSNGQLLSQSTVDLRGSKDTYELETPPPSDSIKKLAATVAQMYYTQKQNTASGAVFGEYGVEHPDSILLTGVDTKSIAYFGGWLGVSVLPVLDAPADTRDCLVKNDKAVWNGVDCGGATASTIGSIGAFGVVTTGPSVAADVVEDISDILSITRKFVLHAPSKAGEIATLFLRVFPQSFLEKAASKADDASVAKKVLQRALLRSAGVSKVEITKMDNAGLLDKKLSTESLIELSDSSNNYRQAAIRVDKLKDSGLSRAEINGIIKTGARAEELYPAAKGVDRTVILTSKTWNTHFVPQGNLRSGHLSKTQLQDTLKKADAVYKNERGMYMWVKQTEEGNMIVRAKDLKKTNSDRLTLEVSTAVRNDNVGELVERFQFEKVPGSK